MRLYALSDLHLEFGDFNVPEVDPDVVVIAGDLHTGPRGLQWAAERLPGVPILYLLGNHEYYGHSMPRLAGKLREAAAAVSSRITVLDRESKTIDGVQFLGATLWTDFELLGQRTAAMAEARDWMSDYRRIRVDPEYRRLRPTDTLAVHRRDLSWLSRSLANPVADRVVVITHHAPSRRSMPTDRDADPVDAAYASNLDDLVEECGAALWIHGHTHHAVDYMIGSTRVLSNPRGYAGNQEVPEFRPDLVLEI